MDRLRRLRDRLESLLERLLDFGDRLHQQAREESDSSHAKSLRADAELVHEARKEIWERHQGDTVKNFSDTVHGNNAPVQITRFSMPKDAHSLITATAVAISILTIVYIDGQRRESNEKLEQAYKDIKTQVWLKQDKEEEKFQKFVAGPYAQLAGELKANEILFQQKCKER